MDAHAFYEFQGLSKPDGRRVDQEQSGSKFGHYLRNAGSYADGADRGKPQRSFPDVKLQRHELDQPPMTKEQCMVTHTHVKGMDLTTREWGEYPFSYTIIDSLPS